MTNRLQNKNRQINITLLILAGLLLSGLLFLNTKFLPVSFLSRKILNSGHLLLFAALGFIILQLVNFQSGLRPPRNYRLSILLGSGFALLSEWLQQFVGREFEFNDILLNLAGILLIHGACYLFYCKATPVSGILKILFLTATLSLLGGIIWDIAVTIQRHYFLERQLPVITSFENDWELFRWELNDSTQAGIVRDPVNPAGRRLEIACRTGWYPGVVLEYPPQDWRCYQALKFTVSQPDSLPLELFVRIDDRSDGTPGRNRIYFQFEIQAGRQEICVPFPEIQAQAKDSVFDFAKVRRLVFFLDRPDRPRTFWLDDLRLIE